MVGVIAPPGFISEVTEMLADRLPHTNRDWLQGIAEVLLSTASWKVSVTDQMGTLCINIWLQYIAPSGDGKTVPIDNFLNPTIIELERLLNTEEALYVLFLGHYTGEGIMKHFANEGLQVSKDGEKTKKRTIYNLGLLCKDEATMSIQNATHKNYMAGIVEVESKIYDGTLYRKVTTSRGLEAVDKCYKASIASTTPAIYELMKNDGFIQGGWNRYDMLVGNPLKVEDVKMLGEDFFVAREELSRFESIPIDYATRLLKITKGNDIRVFLDEDASLIWRGYQFEMKKAAVALPDLDLRRGYLNRQAEKALKRGCLYTISRWFDRIDSYDFPTAKISKTNPDGSTTAEEVRIVVCTAAEMKAAIENQQEYYKHWLQMLDDRKHMQPESKVTNDAAEMEFFRQCCKREPLLSRKMLIGFTSWKDGNKKLTDNIDTAKMTRKLYQLTIEETQKVIEEHRGDMEWFDHMMISPSFKTLPCLYRWVGD